MKIQYKASLLFFLFSTAFLSIGVFGYDFFSDRGIIERVGLSQLSLTDELALHVESHLEEKSANAMALANTPLLRIALRKSNEEYSKLYDNERKAQINSLNSRWMETDTIEDPFIQSYMNNPVADHLKSHQQLFPEEFGEIFLTNRYGAIIATTKKLTTLAHSHKYWWVTSYNDGKGRIFIDDRGFDTSVGGYVLGVVIPIMEKKEILGILKCNINILGPISHMIEAFNNSNYGVLKLIRSGGLIVIAEGLEPLSTQASEPIIKELGKKVKGAKMMKLDEIEYLVTYAPVPLTLGSKKYGFGGKKESIDQLKGNLGEAWHTLIVRERSDVLQTSHESLNFFIKLGIALSLAMAVFAFFIGKLISRPIVKFSETAKKIGRGNLDVEITTRSKDELGILAVSFNKMTKNLKKITTSRDELNREIEERKQILERTEQLNRLNGKLLESGNLGEKLGLITDSIVKIFKADFARVWMIKPGDLCNFDCQHANAKEEAYICYHQGYCLHLVASSGRYSHINGGHRRVPFGCYKIGKIATGDESKILSNDVLTDPRIHNHEWANKLGLVSFAGYRLLSPDGRVTGVLGLFSKQTITSEEDTQLESLAGTTAQVIQAAKTKEALHDSEKKYRGLVEDTVDLITRSDSKGKFIYVNYVAEKIFGISKDKCIGMSSFEFIHPDDKEYTQTWFKNIIKGQKTRGTIEIRQINKITGEIYIMLWACTFFYDDKGKVTSINSIARDLTRYKKIEDELLKTKKLESAGILSGGIAHDFNNLLSIIMGYISLVKNDIKFENKTTELLNKAETASLKATKLVKQLITFSKGSELVKRTGSIKELAIEIIHFTFSGSIITQKFSFSENLSLIRFDKNQMKHALQNIFDNAAESMPHGGLINVKAENFEISSETIEESLPLEKGNYIKISIQDNGVGISEEHLPKIFDPYFSTKDRGVQKGMGLGLAATYSIIKGHDGYITVKSKVNKGTTFEIYLPAAEKKRIEENEKILPEKIGDV